MKKSKLMKTIMLTLACGAFFTLGNTNTALASPAVSTVPAETIVASQLDNSWDKKFPVKCQCKAAENHLPQPLWYYLGC